MSSLSTEDYLRLVLQTLPNLSTMTTEEQWNLFFNIESLPPILQETMPESLRTDILSYKPQINLTLLAFGLVQGSGQQVFEFVKELRKQIPACKASDTADLHRAMDKAIILFQNPPKKGETPPSKHC